MQITSLTDFPFKLTPVYIIKVAFRLENRDRTREHPDGKEGEGQFGAYQDDPALISGQQEWGIGASSHGHWLCLP